MAALSRPRTALPFLRADERPPAPAWLAEASELRFPPRGAVADARRYHALCDGLSRFDLLPGAARAGVHLSLPLDLGPLRFTLRGRVAAEFLSSEQGEAQRHLQAAFDLPGEWILHWRLFAGQDLLSGRVRLHSATWVQPGPRLSFRHVIAARALRRAVERGLRSLANEALRPGVGQTLLARNP